MNTGTAAVTDYTVTDNLGGYTVGANTVYPLAYNTGTVRYYINGVLQTAPTVTAGPPLTVTGLTIPAGGSAVLIYETTATPVAPLATGSSITNTATITGGGLTNPITAQATVETATSADLTISKSASPTTVTENGQITYTFVISNTGNTEATATGNVVVTDTFAPILRNIAVTYNGTAWTEGTNYTSQRRDRRFHNAGRTDHRSGGHVHAEHRRDVHRHARHGHTRHHRHSLTIHHTNDSVPGFGRGLSLPKKALPVPVFPWYNSRNLRLSTNCAHIGRSKRDLWKRKPFILPASGRGCTTRSYSPPVSSARIPICSAAAFSATRKPATLSFSASRSARGAGQAPCTMLSRSPPMRSARSFPSSSLTMKHRFHIRWETILVAVEIVFVAVLGALPASTPVQVFQVSINFIASMQYNTFRNSEGVPMATTFATNHVRQLGIGLAKELHRRHGDTSHRRVLKRHFSMVLFFLAGTILGAVACIFLGRRAIWVAAPLRHRFRCLSPRRPHLGKRVAGARSRGTLSSGARFSCFPDHFAL